MRRPYRILVRLIVSVVVVCQAALFLQQRQAPAAWPVFGVALGCALLGWLGFSVVNQFKRGDSTRAVEVVAWSSLIGLVALVAALAFADVAFG